MELSGSGEAQPRRERRGRALAGSAAARAALVVAAILALLWAIQGVDALSGYWLLRFGIVPRTPGKLEDILSAPLLHASWAHLADDTPPLALLGFFAALRGLRRFAKLSLLVVVVSGLGVWLVAPAHTDTVGASGVVFGYLGYLLARGAIERRLIDVLIALLVGALYWSVLPLLLPGNPGISWQAHLFGLAGGILGAWWLRSTGGRPSPEVDRRPSAPPATRLRPDLFTLGPVVPPGGPTAGSPGRPVVPSGAPAGRDRRAGEPPATS